MATGKNGYFDLSGTNGMSLRVNWSETYDIQGNKSTVKITSVQVKSGTYSGQTYYVDGIIKINGTTVFSMDSSAGYYSVTVNATGTWYSVKRSGAAISGSVDVSHNTDGTKTTTIEVTGNNWEGLRGFTTSGSDGNNWKVSGTKSIELTEIPRASTIGVTDANIGSTCMIAVNKKLSSYTHSIKYSFGSLSGYITESGTSSTEVKLSGTSISWSVPTTFYAQIPKAKSGVCTFTCTTYSGSTAIGSAQTAKATFTASETLCAPSLSASVKDVNESTKALTGNDDTLVRYFSTARCTITASAENSASISGKTINGTAVSGTSLDIPGVSSGTFTFAATDSRGYTTIKTVAKTLIPYVKLTNNATCNRTDPTSGKATLKCSGAWFNGNFGSTDNTLTVTYSINGGDAVSIPVVPDGNKYSAEVTLTGLTYTYSHRVTVTVSDALDTVEKTITIMRGVPIFDWGENDFSFNVPATMNDYLILTKRDMQCGWFNPGSVPANTYVDYTVDFDIPFENTPRVVTQIYSDTQSYNYHFLAPVVLSQATTGFTFRIFNASAAELYPTVNWIAAVN